MTPIDTNSALVLEKHVCSLLADFEFDKAFEVINAFTPKSTVEERITIHMQAKVYLMMGAYRKSRALLSQIRSDYGDNIRVLTDLAVTYYHLGEVDQWRTCYLKMEQVLRDFGDFLSFHSKNDALILVAKFYEEDAKINRSMGLYLQAIKELEASSEVNESESMLTEYYCQVTRIYSMFNDIEKLGPLYTKLLSIPSLNLSKSLKVEVEHALMMAEVHLVGSQHAWTRVDSLLSDDALPMTDKRLVFYDFIEEQLIRKKEIQSEWLELFPQAHPDNHEEEWLFEDEIYALAFAPERKRSLAGLSRLAAVVPLSTYLRIMIVHLSQENNLALAQEIKSKINLILSSLEPASRVYWQNRMKPFLQTQDLVLEFSPAQRAITYQKKTLDLSRKRTMLGLMTLLCESPSLTVDQAIESLWESSYSPEHYHRLRMTAHRLNQLLFDLTANPKVIEVSAEAVNLNSSISLGLDA